MNATTWSVFATATAPAVESRAALMAAKPGRFPAALLDEIEARVKRGDARELLQESPEVRGVIGGGGRGWLCGLLDERARARETERASLRAPALASVRTMAEGLRGLAATDPAAGDELSAALTFEAKVMLSSTRRSA